MSYYYFGASLPSLTMETPPALSFAQFCEQCQQHLSKRDSRAVAGLVDTAAATPANGFIGRWQRMEHQLRNALVKVRAQRLNRDASGSLDADAGVDSAAEKAAADAFARPTPLERERALDQFRWSQADALATFDPFSLDAILAYGVKLKIAERWAQFDDDAGQKLSRTIVTQQPAAYHGEGSD